MAVEWLTYGDIGRRLGCSAEAARARAIRHEWPRRTGNDGRTECKVDVEEFEAAIPPYRREKTAERPVEARSTPELDPVEPPIDTRTIEALEQHIATLKGFVATAEAMSTKAEKRAVTADARMEIERSRADVERARADGLAAELAQVRADGAAEVADVERQVVELRSVVEAMKASDARADARGAALDAKIDSVRAEAAALRERPWWRRLSG